MKVFGGSTANDEWQSAWVRRMGVCGDGGERSFCLSEQSDHTVSSSRIRVSRIIC